MPREADAKDNPVSHCSLPDSRQSYEFLAVKFKGEFSTMEGTDTPLSPGGRVLLVT